MALEAPGITVAHSLNKSARDNESKCGTIDDCEARKSLEVLECSGNAIVLASLSRNHLANTKKGFGESEKQINKNNCRTILILKDI